MQLETQFAASDLPDTLRETMRVILKLNRSRRGTKLLVSTTRLAVELGVCMRTAQRRVQRLIELKVVSQIGEPNEYEAHPEILKPRPTWKDFETMRATRSYRLKKEV